jgi:phage terminase small subunit
MARLEAKGGSGKPSSKTADSPLSALERRFVDLVVEHDGRKGLREIAVMAGYSESSASQVVRRMLDSHRSPHVVAELRLREQEVAARVAVTRTRHLRDLLELRDKAAEAGQFGAAVQAEFRRGQTSEEGLYVERQEIRVSGIDGMDRETVEQELRALRAELGLGQDERDVTPRVLEHDASEGGQEDEDWLD